MQSLEEIKRKISNTESLKSIIRTMKIMAAISIRQFEKSMRSLESYYSTIELGLQVALKLIDENSPYFTQKENVSGKIGVVVIGSDLGLCGQFNEQIAVFTAKKLQELKISLDRAVILAVGEKIESRLEDSGLKIAEKVLFPAGLQSGITPILSQMLLKLENWRDNLRIEHVFLFNNRPLEDLVSYEPGMSRLLPIDPAFLLELRGRIWESGSRPLVKMDVRKLLSELIRNHLYVALYRAFVESLTGENAARLTSMQAAEKHIDEHIDELRSSYNAERQEGITSELLDIIGGFETMTSNE